MSGLLLILFGKAKKLSNYLARFDKTYICEMQLHEKVEEEKLRKVLSMFIGKIYQKPPLRSAVKKVPRIRRIYELELLDIKERNVLMKVRCEAGTYIRKLCFDIGEILGCGAHMTELRRIAIGFLDEEYKYIATLHELFGAYRIWKETGDEYHLRYYLRPIEELLFHIPKIFIKDSALFSVTHGSFVAEPAIVAVTSDVKRNEYVGVYSLNNELIAIGKSLMDASELIKREKGIVAKIDKVLKVFEKQD